MFKLDHILFLPALISPIFFIAGLFTYFFPPKNINYLYGYRTNSSMKSKERWDFAQKYSSVLMIKLSIILFLISFLFDVFALSEEINLITGIIMLVLIISYMVFKVEKALKTNFTNQ